MKLKQVFKVMVDIPGPLTNAFRERGQSVPLHFEHAIFLKYIDKFKNPLTLPVALISTERDGQAFPEHPDIILFLGNIVILTNASVKAGVWLVNDSLSI